LTHPKQPSYQERTLSRGKRTPAKTMDGNMKKLFFALAFSIAAHTASGQGTILFANYVNGILLAPVFGVSPSDPFTQIHGQSSLGIPGGSTVYSGPLLNGPGYTVALYAGPKNTPAQSLQLVATSSFRPSGVNDLPAGLWFPSAVSVPGVGPGQRVTVEVRVWDNQGGTLTTWAQASADGYTARGTSGAFSPLGILGDPLGTVAGPTSDSPLILVGLTSFNLIPGPLAVPEPAVSAIGILGLGAVFLLRRKAQ
jgi:hypothetical protein